MSISQIIAVAQQSLLLLMYVAGPILGIAVLVGLVVSVLQATTSIQEQTLTFVPKIVAMVGVLFVLGGWMLSLLIEFTIDMFSVIPTLAR